MVKAAPAYRTLKEFVNAQPREREYQDMAAELGILPSQLSQYLNGARTPSREIALRLSREFNISLEGLLDPEAAA